MPNIDDDFTAFENSVQEIIDILNETEEEKPEENTDAKPIRNFDDIDVENVKLKVRENRTLINKTKSSTEENSSTLGGCATMDQQGFMSEVERDAKERAKARAERERICKENRNRGNDAFHKGNYEKAVLLYGKAIESVKNSAITYCNRALCYIKLGNFSRALEDCDYVLDKLDERNLRAWLYRAVAHKRTNDNSKYEESVNNARTHNPTQLAYIDKFIGQMDTDI